MLTIDDRHHCRKCTVPLTADNWWQAQMRKNNYICNSCQAEYRKKWRETNPEKAYREGRTGYNRRREKLREYLYSYAKKNRKIKNVQNKALWWLKKGFIKRKPCSICADENSEMHHPNYDDPFLIDWFCRRHHKRIHQCKD